ncbi:MAG: insulinase family protein [Rhizobiaceae bacterium]|nr:insulinase family protein [Rhizobiaceae bacterium]
MTSTHLTRRFAVIMAFAAALLAFVAPAKAENDVTTFFLDNGLQVVVIPDRRAPVVTHMVWYKVGSADEEPGRSGVAHFLEHLMFKGTERHAAGEFSAVISAIGGSENAFTSQDYTAYYQQVGPESLLTMMEFEADRMRGLILTEEVVAPELDVVIEERRARIDSSPGGLLGEELEATLFQNHPYRMPVIGWMHEIEKLDREQAVAFYDLHYAPNNAILVVAGDVDAGTVRELAERTYGAVPRGPELPPRERPQEPPQDTDRTVTMTDPRVSVPSLQRAWLVPSYNSAAPGEAEALDLLAEILGGGVRSRLYQQLVVKTGIAASAGAGYRASALDDTSFSVYGAPRGEADLAAVEAAIEAQVALIANEGVTDDELRRAKDRFVRSMIFARDSQTGMARIYGALLATGSTVEDIEGWPDRVRAVTADDVRDAARRYLAARAHVTGYLLPQAGAGQ